MKYDKTEGKVLSYGSPEELGRYGVLFRPNVMANSRDSYVVYRDSMARLELPQLR